MPLSSCDECQALKNVEDLIKVLHEKGTLELCEECMEGSDYQNVCHQCGTNHHCDYGTTKFDEYSLFDYCHDCYQGERKKEIDNIFEDAMIYRSIIKKEIDEWCEYSQGFLEKGESECAWTNCFDDDDKAERIASEETLDFIKLDYIHLKDKWEFYWDDDYNLMVEKLD